MGIFIKTDGWIKGKQASIETARLKKIKKIENYSLSPKKCLSCNSCLSYSKQNNKFCNKSCSATYNNKKRERKNLTFENLQCKTCNNKLLRQGIYCNHKCQREFEYNSITYPKFLQGKIKERNVLRKILLRQGLGCSVCKIENWNGKKITLEVDHISGNSDNNMPENLRLLCPNCHSQTETYKGKNKGNGRKSLKQKR